VSIGILSADVAFGSIIGHAGVTASGGILPANPASRSVSETISPVNSRANGYTGVHVCKMGHWG
jgi:hypothetical protein